VKASPGSFAGPLAAKPGAAVDMTLVAEKATVARPRHPRIVRKRPNDYEQKYEKGASGRDTGAPIRVAGPLAAAAPQSTRVGVAEEAAESTAAARASSRAYARPNSLRSSPLVCSNVLRWRAGKFLPARFM
jgi:hypothetical protein